MKSIESKFEEFVKKDKSEPEKNFKNSQSGLKIHGKKKHTIVKKKISLARASGRVGQLARRSSSVFVRVIQSQSQTVSHIE